MKQRKKKLNSRFNFDKSRTNLAKSYIKNNLLECLRWFQKEERGSEVWFGEFEKRWRETEIEKDRRFGLRRDRWRERGKGIGGLGI